MSNAFRDRVVVVTGASSGIGRELASRLARGGAWLSLAARDRARLEEVGSECRDHGGRALIVPTDVVEEEQCRTLIDRTVEEYGRLDILVCNAGLTMLARFDELRDLSPLESLMRINYLGSAYCVFHALRHLKESKGLIVGVSSVAGLFGVPLRTVYSATKHAQAGFFDSLRIELADHGVDVTMIYPGYVATGIRERALGPNGEPLGESPAREDAAMSVERCVDLMVEGIEHRRREVVMTPRARVGRWLQLLAPSLVDRMARRAVERGR